MALFWQHTMLWVGRVGARGVHLRSSSRRWGSTLALQHVLYLGSVLGHVSPERLSKFPRSWLDSVGRSAEVDHGLRWTAVHATAFHTLMAYTLVEYAPRRAPRYTTEDVSLPGAKPRAHHERTATIDLHLDVDGEATAAEGSVLPSRVFGVGRNTYAQLGLGFASQEATRGMMSGNISGVGGITHLVTGGNGFSFIVTRDTNNNGTVYAVGNDTLGAVGLGDGVVVGKRDAWDVVSPTTSEPQLVLYPLPRPIALPDPTLVRSIAAGMDHSLLLVEDGAGKQRVLSTGLNTDGQLGLTTDAHTLPIQPLVSKTFTHVPVPADARLSHVVCGADSSFVITANSDIWAWGNSEYGQCLCGVHDRIVQPTLVGNPLLPAYARAHLPHSTDSSSPPQIQKLVSGGSFTAVLDTNGRVWVAGYGPVPCQDARTPPHTHDTLQLVTHYGEHSSETCKAVNLFCGLDYIVAVTKAEGEAVPSIWIWGVPPPSVSTVPIRTPTRVPYSLPYGETATPAGNVQVQDVACNKDHLIVLLSDTPHSHDDAEQQVWAECVPPTSITT